LRNQSNVVWFDTEHPDVYHSMVDYISGHHALCVNKLKNEQ